MYVRTKPNKSGSTSVQIISKVRGKYKVVKTVGCATTQQEIKKLSKQTPLFHSEKDELVEEVAKSGANRTVIPEYAGHPFRTMADSHSG